MVSNKIFLRTNNYKNYSVSSIDLTHKVIKRQSDTQSKKTLTRPWLHLPGGVKHTFHFVFQRVENAIKAKKFKGLSGI